MEDDRKLFWAVLVIGLALVIAPFALSMPTKTAAGQRMLNGFQPITQPNQVATTAYYYNDVFVPLGKVTPMMSAQNVQHFRAYLKGSGGMQTDAAKLVPMLGQAMHTTPAQVQVQALMAGQLPAMAAMLQNLPEMARNVGIFGQVPGGLRHYKPLVMTMQANVHNYQQVNSLPDFRLFTWFFVVPGAARPAGHLRPLRDADSGTHVPPPSPEADTGMIVAVSLAGGRLPARS